MFGFRDTFGASGLEQKIQTGKFSQEDRRNFPNKQEIMCSSSASMLYFLRLDSICWLFGRHRGNGCQGGVGWGGGGAGIGAGFSSQSEVRMIGMFE